jgi:hypothetical protein
MAPNAPYTPRRGRSSRHLARFKVRDHARALLPDPPDELRVGHDGTVVAVFDGTPRMLFRSLTSCLALLRIHEGDLSNIG